MLEPIVAGVLDEFSAEASRGFRARAVDHLTASLRRVDRLIVASQDVRGRQELARAVSLTSSSPAPGSAMVALFPRGEEAAALAHSGGEPAGVLHCTLAFLGEPDGATIARAVDACKRVAMAHAPLEGVVGGVGSFGAPSIVMPDVPGLVELRTAVCEALVDCTVPYARDHGYAAHITVAYSDDPGGTGDPGRIGQPLHFDSVRVVLDDRTVADLPLHGRPPVTAAGTPNPPQWSAPQPNELVDVQKLVAALRAKTDPVRLEVVRTIVGAAMPFTDPGGSALKVEVFDHVDQALFVRVEDELFNKWQTENDQVVDVAFDALGEAERGAGKLYLAVDRETGEIRAVANIERIDDALVVSNIASPGGGAGTALLRDLAREAHDGGVGIRLVGTPESAPYYRKLGFVEDKEGLLTFELPFASTAAFAGAHVAQAVTTSRVGLTFDITNPLVARVLEQAGSQIVNIAETTQLNVMRIIDASYREGLSIDHTAEAIMAGMREATVERARLIARTELVGAVNGGSLAAVDIVAEATGVEMTKTWMTGPGAKYPRHELVDGLDGQTVGLKDQFDVDGEALSFPGDPSGSPEQVCNCRCVAPWVEVSGGLTAASRRMFEGKLVWLSTAGGREVAVTPNHPILTRRGWITAGDLKKGDDLVCRAILYPSIGGPDVQDVPTEAEQHFASLEFSSTRSQRIRVGAMDFHGEVPIGEVEVVWADNLLAFEGNSALEEHLRELSLALAEREMGLDRYGAALCGVEESQPVSLSGATETRGAVPFEDRRHCSTTDTEPAGESKDAFSCVVATRDFRSDSGVPLVEAGALAVAVRPADVATTEMLPNGHCTDATLVRDLLVAHSGLIEIDPLVDIRYSDYTGHVYNFSSASGTYAIDGIISANCTMSYSDAGGDIGE